MYTKPMALNQKLIDNVPTQYALAMTVPDLYGVEVELEGKKVKTGLPGVHHWWAQVNDNSLRVKQQHDEAIEYVLRAPCTYDDTILAVKNLFDHLTSPGVEVYKSYRTSIHVHLSCLLETHRTIYNFMTLCMIFDELLTSQNGRHRAGNNFCLRTKDAQGQVEDVIYSIDCHGSFLGIDHNKRYSSINFVSLLKYGTIEFRSLECTTDFNRMKHWMDTLGRLKKSARTFDNPQAIIRQFSLMSPTEFLHVILGPCAAKYIAVKGWEVMLQQGMRLAQDLAYSANWTSLKVGEVPVIGKPVVKKKKIPQGIDDFVAQHQVPPQGVHAVPPDWWNNAGGGIQAAQAHFAQQAPPPAQPVPGNGDF